MKESIGRALIYFAVFASVVIPLVATIRAPTPPLAPAERLFNTIESISANDKSSIAILGFDFGPNTRAENESQAEVVFEHLLRREVPVVLMTLSPYGRGFLSSIPERVIKRLISEDPTKKYEYGVAWANLGYRPGMAVFLQALAKSNDIPSFLGVDAFGTKINSMPIFKDVLTLDQVKLVGQFTGYVGFFDAYVQFLQRKGYVPSLVHGCTSITIPEAYIYLDSGQLSGLLEGVSGAAWYEELLSKATPSRQWGSGVRINTALGVTQLLILLLILLGNISELGKLWRI
jgi:hypothetical protein